MSTPDRKPDPELEPEEALRAELEAELEAETGVFDAEPGLEAEAALDAGGNADHDIDEPELTVAFSPRQILGGFALLAAIIVWLFRRRSK